MRKLRLLVVGALLAFPIVGTVASPAHACVDNTDLKVCGTVNYVCQKLKGRDCVG
jgi:hypothetical protein